VRKFKEERAMKVEKFNKRDTRFAPWAALCVLSLIAAMVFALPSLVFAQITGELSQECNFALIGTEHTITAKVTEDGAPGATVPVFFYSTDSPNYGQYMSVVSSFDENGIATFTYKVDSVNQVDISLIWVMQDGSYKWVTLNTVTTNWTAEDLCSSSQQVLVGGRFTLNAKKKGALKIAVCATDDLDVNNVNLETVYLVGVAPWHSKQKDSRLCPDGKDGDKDLVLKFKNREVVKALEKDLGKELVDGDDDVTLALTGELYDGTPFGGEWVVDIEKDGKRHGKKNYHQKNGKEDKKDKKGKGSN
jgi:hypothetical protein